MNGDGTTGGEPLPHQPVDMHHGLPPENNPVKRWFRALLWLVPPGILFLSWKGLVWGVHYHVPDGLALPAMLGWIVLNAVFLGGAAWFYAAMEDRRGPVAMGLLHSTLFFFLVEMLFILPVAFYFLLKIIPWMPYV